MTVLHKLRRLSWTERLMLVEALIWLAIARLALLFVPFKRIAPHLGSFMAETPTDIPGPDETENVSRIGWAVCAAARRTPWKSPCLVQAVAAKGMLRRRSIPSTLYLGVGLNEIDGFQAHAWLRSGETVLTGAEHKGRFTTITTFGEEL